MRRANGRFRKGHKENRSPQSGKVLTDKGWQYPEGFHQPLNPQERTTVFSLRITTSGRLRLERLARQANLTPAHFLRNIIDALDKVSHTPPTGTAP